MPKPLRIGTRASPLALRQAEIVASLIQKHHNLEVELEPITTEGDRRLDVSVSKFGGKGIFLKELETALLNGAVDLCVHSMKDVPVQSVKGLEISALLPRDDVRDGFISNTYPNLEAMPKGAVVGTSSARRKALIMSRYPNIRIENLRGNIHTRLSKLDNGDYDAIVLAMAGLERMDMLERVTSPMDPNTFTPAITQGIVGIETRQGDEITRQIVRALNNPQSNVVATAERAVSIGLGGDCHLPLAAWARCDGDVVTLDAGVFESDGSQCLDVQVSGKASEAHNLGLQAAERLIRSGAAPILERARALSQP